MTKKYAYEYGKRWDARTPRDSIRYLLDRIHVETPFAEVEADLNRRMDGAKINEPRLVREAIAYARIVHERNRDLYRKVMSGQVG
jgi:hypothetical protein